MAKKSKAAKPQGAYEYAVMQIVTIAPFKRLPVVRRCDVHRYHAWIWRSPEKLDLADLKQHIPHGLKCQCGALTHD